MPVDSADLARVLDRFVVRPESRFRLKDHDPGWRGEGEIAELSDKEIKARGREFLDRNIVALSRAQELLWANGTYGVLIVLQAMDAAGKDGLIKHVMRGINPQGCVVTSFKQPSGEELAHSYLWRISKATPRRGQIAIFNRSHYEDVIAVRVNPHWLERASLPPSVLDRMPPKPRFWRRRFEEIVAFEEHLVRNGTLVLKFFLHLSREEQRRRFLERIDDPAKNWKFSPSDLTERAHWDTYQEIYEETIAATSTPSAPWHVLPADHKWVARSLASAIVTRSIESLGLEAPRVGEAERAQLEHARAALLAEG
jgi:PPK2 family polyphosphate:nucleotide phosphotransferase